MGIQFSRSIEKVREEIMAELMSAVYCPQHRAKIEQLKMKSDLIDTEAFSE